MNALKRRAAATTATGWWCRGAANTDDIDDGNDNENDEPESDDDGSDDENEDMDEINDDDEEDDSNIALRTFARWIQGNGDAANEKDSYRCRNILVLTGAGISCSAGSEYTIYIYYLFILLFYSNLFSFLFFFSR